MMRKVIVVPLLATMAVVVPGGSHVAAKTEGGTIKIATLAPRGSDLERDFRKINKRIKDATGGRWSIKFYPSGVAGDEKDVIRKMRVGMMDASLITTTGLSQIVREVAVLDAPGVIRSYKQLDRVKQSMSAEWEKTFASRGYNLMAWGEGGEYRMFSKRPIRSIKHIKGMRPWLWPQSQTWREIYRYVGATGIPLGVPEVYGALQTNMVDAVPATGIAAVALQWWSKVKYVTEETTGVLVFGFVMTNTRWNSLPDDVRKVLAEEAKKTTGSAVKSIRRSDRRAIEKLIKRGMKSVKWDARALADYETMAIAVRKRLTGRMYPASLLKRVQAAAGPR